MLSSTGYALRDMEHGKGVLIEVARAEDNITPSDSLPGEMENAENAG